MGTTTGRGRWFQMSEVATRLTEFCCSYADFSVILPVCALSMNVMFKICSIHVPDGFHCNRGT